MSSSTAAVPTYTAAGRKKIIGFAFLGTLLDGADFAIFLYFLVAISASFEVSLVSAAAIQAISYLTGILGGVLFGALADRRGRRFGLTLTVAVYSIFTLASAFAPNFTVLLILRALAGIGIGGESGIAFAYVNEAYPGRAGRRGLLSAALQTMFQFGILLAVGVFQITSAHYGDQAWRWAFGYLGAAGLISFAIRSFMPESKVWLAARNGPSRPRATLADLTHSGLRRTTLIATTMMTFAFLGAYTAITYGPTMWQQTYALAPGDVALIGYAGTAVSIVSYLACGLIADQYGRRPAFITLATVGSVGYTLFLIAAPTGLITVPADSPWSSPLVPIFLLIQFGYGYFGAQGAWLSELFPTHVRATAQNVVYYVGRALGAGLGPLLALTAAQGLGEDLRLAVGLGLLGVALTALFAACLPETRGAGLLSDR